MQTIDEIKTPETKAEKDLQVKILECIVENIIEYNTSPQEVINVLNYVKSLHTKRFGS